MPRKKSEEKISEEKPEAIEAPLKKKRGRPKKAVAEVKEAEVKEEKVKKEKKDIQTPFFKIQAEYQFYI